MLVIVIIIGIFMSLIIYYNKCLKNFCTYVKNYDKFSNIYWQRKKYMGYRFRYTEELNIFYL